MVGIEEVLTRLEGVKQSGDGWIARCPAHDDHHPSLSIHEGDNGRLLFKCFAGCPYEAIRDALRGRPWKRAFGLPGHAGRAQLGAKERSGLARRILREARDPRGTIVQDYLFGRGWTGEMPKPLCARADPAELARAGIGLAIPPSIRFHPRLWHESGIYLPAMVAAIEDLDGRIVGVHRTYLKPDGTGKAEVKPNKMALGRSRGCAVHLTAGAPEQVLCEGIETGLSILQATGLHVWAALGTSNLGQVELPGFVREVIIAADNDEPGIKAASAAAEAYRAHGYQVQILSPRNEDWDFNQVVEAGRNNGRAQSV